MFTWPENILPLPEATFGGVTEPTVARTTMDSGRRRQRRRSTEAINTAKVTFVLTKDEYASFVGVWAHKIDSGAAWFTMRLPRPDGESLTLSTVRFTTGFSDQHRAFENWQLTLSLEFFQSTSLSEDVIDVLIAEGYDTSAYQEAVAAMWAEVGHWQPEHPFN